MQSTSTRAGFGNPAAPGRLTLAVSRASSRSDAGAKAVGVGSSALFGPGVIRALVLSQGFFCAGFPTAATPTRAFRQKGVVVRCACLWHE
jgi:hypothetical protein